MGIQETYVLGAPRAQDAVDLFAGEWASHLPGLDAVTGGAELWETIDPASETYLDSSHGVILFGIVTAMRGFVEMVEGLEIMGIDAEIRHSRGTLDDDGGAG